MKKRTLLVALGFTQMTLAGGTALAQFSDELCQTDPQGLQCFDNGCSELQGECVAVQGQPDPQQQDDQPQEQQGCVCDTPFEPQNQCSIVHDEQGEEFCVDLGCPPVQGYNCNEACKCEEPQGFGDDKCQPDFEFPSVCQDLGCSAMGPGWECESIQAQEPHPPGEPQQGIGGCKCKSPDPQGQPHCDVVFPFPPTGGGPLCVDFQCGGMTSYDCKFSPDEGICDCICDTVVPTPELKILFTTKEDLEWMGPGSLCASVYNVYRQDSFMMPDAVAPFKVADDYGFCLVSGLLVSHATDFAVPPASITQHYLVTSESPFGESPLGFTSAPTSALRPNSAPCPSPPPLP